MITNRLPLAIAALWLALAVVTPAQSPNSTNAQGKTVAVVIGVSKYAKLGGGQQLQFADRDALLVGEALKKAGVAADNLRVLAAQEATVAAMKAALGNWLAHTAGADDTVIIFFSGHGFFEQEFGEAYLLGADSDAKEPFATALSLGDIQQALTRRVRARRVLLITDALRRDFFDPDTNGAAAASFIQALDHLATAREGLSVIAASSPNEYSREGQRWNGQGVFAKHFAAALTTGQYIDRNGDGRLTADELLEVLAPLVAEDTANKQHIWHSNTPLAQIALAGIARNQDAAAVAAKGNEVRKVDVPPNAPTVASLPSRPASQSHTANTPPANKPAPVAAKTPEASLARAESAGSVPATTKAVPSGPTAKAEAPPASRKSEAPKVEPSAAVNTVPPEKITARTEPGAAPPATRPSAGPSNAARVPLKSPPSTGAVPPAESSNQPSVSSITIPSTAAGAPPRPVAALPKLGEVAAEPERKPEAVAAASPALTSAIEAAPSPLILQVEAAIAAKNLLEPKNQSAWDIYQKLAADPVVASEAARLRPVLAEALIAAGRAIVAGDVYSDSIADRVDDFRRAGQMLARARSLRPENVEISTLEKLSAAQALIALQFYEEAERALSQLQAVKLAAIENAMGLVYQGKLDSYRAERAFKRAAEIDPNWAAPHYNLALLYRGQQNDAALGELEKAAALNAKSVTMIVALGDEYFARQQWPRAAESYRQAITIKPNDDGLHTKLGHALYSQGLQAEANREYEKARALRSRQQ
jgi:tetratricopeptide (TPR) repeat protein